LYSGVYIHYGETWAGQYIILQKYVLKFHWVIIAEELHMCYKGIKPCDWYRSMGGCGEY
jgi:hypothetical protein